MTNSRGLSDIPGLEKQGTFLLLQPEAQEIEWMSVVKCGEGPLASSRMQRSRHNKQVHSELLIVDCEIEIELRLDRQIHWPATSVEL